MRSGILLIFLIFCADYLLAQKNRFSDFGFFSIDKPFPVSEPKTFTPVFLFDGQNIFINARSVRLGGIKGGVQHNPSGIRAGLGFYAFTNRLISKNATIAELVVPTTIESDFGLMNLFVEPTLLRNKRFFISTPVTFGYGAIDQYYTTILGSLRPLRKLSLTTFSVQANAEVYLFYWLGIGGGLGYHHFGTADKRVQSDYSGFMYNIKLKIDILDLYKTVVHQLNKSEQ